MSSIWDEPGMTPNDDYVRFETPGDTVTGVITLVDVHRWDDGSVCPQLTLRLPDGESTTLTAGQTRLKRLLAEQRPEVGDTITVTHTHVEKRSGGKTLKHFDLAVVKAGQAVAQAQPPAQAPASAADMAAAQQILGTTFQQQ